MTAPAAAPPPLGQPVRPRHAASLVLLRRPASGEAEVLMGQRPKKSRFAPDVFVFPGGAVDADDRLRRPLAPLHETCVRRSAASPRFANALAQAALRETHEETGLLIAPDLSKLTFLARAITPTNSPIRFHARFFLADAEQAQGEMADSNELANLAWRPLSQAVQLPAFDITEIVLRSLMQDAPPSPFFYRYRRGAGHKSLLD